MPTDTILGEDLQRLVDLDFDFEAACEVQERARKAGHGMPMCDGRPARWVGWRSNCCPESPRYLLLCDECKQIYQNWMATHASITCADCNQETGGFIAFTELNRKS